MKLKALSMADMLQVANWRNEQLPMLRTPFPLTDEMQMEFYKNVVCNRQANARFWGLCKDVQEKYECPYNCNGVKVGCSLERLCYPVCPFVHRFKDHSSQKLIGMCGLENIQWENRLGEISLLLNPEYSTDEYLSEALDLVLREGFAGLNMENIFTEVYESSLYLEFWQSIAVRLDATVSDLPSRKYHDGQYWDSYYINFNKVRYMEHENTIPKSTQTPD